MGISSPNADSAKTLPLFRPEALAARENLHGAVLGIRAFSPAFLLTFFVSIAIATLVFLLVTKYEPRARVSGELVSLPQDKASQLLATFDVAVAWTSGFHTGTRLIVHCSGCKHDLSLNGTITGLSLVQRAGVQRAGVHVVSASSDSAGTVSRVTVALSPLNSPPMDVEQLRRGAKLEAEFPLESRPLIRLLTGALVP